MPKLLPNIKQELLQKAKHTICRYGYKELNIRNLAKECNIGIGTFYNYFPNKDELVKEILKDDWNSVILLFSEITYDDNFSCKEKLNYIFEKMNKFLLNYMNTFMIFLATSKKTYDTHNNILSPLKKIILNILLFHKDKNEISPIISCEKLSKLILTNIITICKDHYITFEEFYNCLNM